MGTVKGREKLDALDLLVVQHDVVERLFEEIENEPLIERKQFLFDELADRITAHAALEETLLYPAVRATQTQDILIETDHLAIKRALAELLHTEVDDEGFDTKLAVLGQEIHQHAREDEELVLFPKLRRLMSAEQRAALGTEMQAMSDRLLAGKPSLQGSAEATPSTQELSR